MKFVYCMSVEVYRNTLKPHLHALKKSAPHTKFLALC